ncbi:MAG: ABC transporter permease [Vicinamibacterales bacterium]
MIRFCAHLVDDFRWAIRSLSRRPTQTVVTVIMLAVGIGANGAVFAVVNAALFKGFAFVHQNERLVQISTSRNSIYVPDVLEWRAQARTFQDIALVRGVFHTLNDQRDAPDTVFTTEVTPNTFRLLGVAPRFGRDFVEADSVPGAEPVVILRHALWQRWFGADPAVIGRSIRLDGVPTTIIGVMPDGFTFPADQDLWTPLIPTAAALRRDTPYARYAYGRLAEGSSIDAAQKELEEIGQRLAQAYPTTNRDLRPVASPFNEWFVGRDARRLYVGVWGAVGCVLLIACANVAGLLVLEAMGRSHEMAVHLALGADRWRLVRQYAVEGLVLSSLGGLVGLWISHVALRLVRLTPNTSVLDLKVDEWTLGYLAAITVITGVTAGVSTAAYLTRLHAAGLTGQTTRSITGNRTGTRVLDALVSVEMALAVLLLIGAGVMIRSVRQVTTADIGVVTEDVWTASLYLPPDRYPGADARVAFFRDLADRVAALPGIEAVGFGAVPPTEVVPRMVYVLPEQIPVSPASTIATCVISPGYVRTLRASVLAGRDFTDADRSVAPPVALVNQRFVDTHWPGQSAIGKRLRLNAATAPATGGPWVTVVGVTSNIGQNDRTRQSFEPMVYLPYAQQPQANMFLFTRSRNADATIAGALRAVVYARDPNLPVPALWPLRERLGRAYAVERQTTVVLGGFAAVALALASVGLYTVVAHAVSRRTREIGVRIALGATPRAVVGWVAARAVRPLAVGVVAGGCLALMATQLVASQLVGVSPTDPLTIAGALTALGGATTLGCWLPARRAARTDPATTLRME